MVKVVENGERICTVTLDGSESSVVFQNDYKYFAVKNESDADVYVSLNRDIVEGADGVMTIGSKESALFAHMKPNVNMFFVKGTGKIQVFASSNAVNPFRNAPVADGGVMASGNPVQLDGLQGGVPFSEMIVSGKNCIDANTYSTNANVTDNGDNIFVEWTNAMYVRYTAVLSPNTDYILSWEQKADNGIDVVRANVVNAETNKTIKQQNSADVASGTDYVKNYFAFNTGNCSNAIIQFIRATNTGNVYIKKTIQLELGATPTAYEPPITGRELTVNVSGKNLMKYPYYNTTQTQNGVTFTDNGDGSITVNGTATATAYFSLSSNKALPTGKYVLGKSMDNILLYVDKYLDNAFYQRLATSTETIKELIFNVSEEDAQKYTYKFGIQINKGNIADNVTIYPQLEIGSTATPYEPYHGSTTTITPTSNPYTIPDDIRQQDGLNVVSVSGGELSVTGVRKNAAVKKIWDKIDELTTAIIVSNGETE